MCSYFTGLWMSFIVEDGSRAGDHACKSKPLGVISLLCFPAARVCGISGGILLVVVVVVPPVNFRESRSSKRAW
jgi:hypothetical protein